MSVLRNRYASASMREIWSTENKVSLERKLWIAVMKSQKKIGVDIPEEAIRAYEEVAGVINLQSMELRERVLRHDVKARIEEFSELAGFELIHLGMTSRDLTENVELYQLKNSLELTRDKVMALLSRFASRSEEFVNIPIVGRTHNVPAQVTTLGRRFASWAEELLFSLKHLNELVTRLPMRGIKGALGTSTDLMALAGEDFGSIDQSASELFGFQDNLGASSQIYPRSIDLEVLAVLNQIAATPSNMAINIRLMSGFGLLSEGFEGAQTGSSAMPHKINPRLSERVNSLTIALKGFLTMINEISGNQWNEGDVSCSAVRRIALPGAFFAIDGILDTSIFILDSINVHEENIAQELDRFLPVLLSSRLLVLAVKSGVGREVAHEQIKNHVRLAEIDFKEGKGNTFLQRVIEDRLLKIEAKDIAALLQNPIELAGAAKIQTVEIVNQIRSLIKSHPTAFSYKPVSVI